MKKIIGLGIGVASVIGLVASGTWAIFSDTETSQGGQPVYACGVESYTPGPEARR